MSFELRAEIDRLVRILIGSEGRQRKEAADRLVEIGEPAVEPVIQVLKTGFGLARTFAVGVLRDIADPRTTDTLLQLLDDPDKMVVAHAATGLGNIGAPSAREPLIQLLTNHEDWLVRGDAARALGRIGGSQNLGLLIEALQDEQSYVRTTACSALGEIGDTRAVEALIAALQDESYKTRRFAAEALGRISDPRAEAPLRATLQDPVPEVREAVGTALENIGDARAKETPDAARKDEPRRAREVAERVPKGMAAQCSFCGKRVHEGRGIVALGLTGADKEDPFATMQKAADEMLARRVVCAGCGAVFCLECGNAEGHKRGSGKTHCPKCGRAVPSSQL